MTTLSKKKKLEHGKEIALRSSEFFYLNNSTILENVAFAKDLKEIKRDDVWKSLESAKLKELVETLPKGLNTAIGENGIKLSEGKRVTTCLVELFIANQDFLSWMKLQVL